MLAAAAAWSGLAADFSAAAAGHRSVISELTGGPWVGPASAALVAAATPFISWLDGSADSAGQAAVQAFAAAAAFETAFAASVPPPVIAANRALLAALVATNFLGQNTPAIAATEALYLEFWAQDAAAMYNYAGSSAAASELTELPEPAEVVNPGGVADQAVAVFKSAGQAVQTQLNNVGAQPIPRIGDVLQTLSSPLNGEGSLIDQWLVADTPFDDLVPLYTKYISPYMNSVAFFFQDTFSWATKPRASPNSAASPTTSAARRRRPRRQRKPPPLPYPNCPAASGSCGGPGSGRSAEQRVVGTGELDFGDRAGRIRGDRHQQRHLYFGRGRRRRRQQCPGCPAVRAVRQRRQRPQNSRLRAAADIHDQASGGRLKPAKPRGRHAATVLAGAPRRRPVRPVRRAPGWIRPSRHRHRVRPATVLTVGGRNRPNG